MIDKIQEALASVLQVDAVEIGEGFSTESIKGWNSLAHMKIILELESRFNVRFDPGEILSMTDFESIKAIVRSKSSES